MSSFIHRQFLINSSFHERSMLADVHAVKSNAPRPVIIFCHGFKGFKDWGHFNLIAKEFASRGYIFIKFNFSHNGTTPSTPNDFTDLEAFGNNNISMELDDLSDVLDFVFNGTDALSDLPIDNQRIFLIGHSRGGGIVILKAAEDSRIRAVSAWAPVDDFKNRYSEKILKEWKEKGVYNVENSRTGQQMPLYYQMVEDLYENPTRTDIPSALKNLQMPVQAIHGIDDETLPVEGTKKMVGLNPKIEVLLIKNANHTFNGSHPWSYEELPTETKKAIEASDDFFKRNG